MCGSFSNNPKIFEVSGFFKGSILVPTLKGGSWLGVGLKGNTWVVDLSVSGIGEGWWIGYLDPWLDLSVSGIGIKLPVNWLRLRNQIIITIPKIAKQTLRIITTIIKVDKLSEDVFFAIVVKVEVNVEDEVEVNVDVKVEVNVDVKVKVNVEEEVNFKVVVIFSSQ
jgi:hypothetical protein